MSAPVLDPTRLLERLEWQIKVAAEVQHYDARVTVSAADLERLIAVVRSGGAS